MFFKPVSARRAHAKAVTAPLEVDSTRPIGVWDAWLFAEAAANLALAAWSSAPEGDKAPPYAAYVEALDQEERAAHLLAVRLRAQGPGPPHRPG
jgi:hypothetical protein